MNDKMNQTIKEGDTVAVKVFDWGGPKHAMASAWITGTVNAAIDYNESEFEVYVDLDKTSYIEFLRDTDPELAVDFEHSPSDYPVSISEEIVVLESKS